MSLINQTVNTTNTKAPTAILKSISHGNTIILLKDQFVLGQPFIQSNQIQCQFFIDADYTWHCQYADHCFALTSGMILALDNQVWQFEIPAHQQSQSQQPRVTSLHFQTSCDEEHIFLSIKNNGKTTDLGERVHHYPLLLLARQYRNDHQAGFDHSSCGWLDVEQLTKMMGIETSVLNVQLHRAKQQIAAILPNTHLIERRVGQIRLNTNHFEIIHGSQLECAAM